MFSTGEKNCFNNGDASTWKIAVKQSLYAWILSKSAYFDLRSLREIRRTKNLCNGDVLYFIMLKFYRTDFLHDLCFRIKTNPE